MRHIRRFNESVSSDITFGSIVKYKTPPSERHLNSVFIVKVDGELNDFGKGDWVIMYEVKPDLTDLEIQDIMSINPPSNRNPNDDWYKLPIVNFIPIREPKWRIEKVKDEGYITDKIEESNIGNNIKSYRSFSDDNYINESIMDNIKSYVKKGVLTATILTTLLGNSAYGQTQKDAIKNSLKNEIIQPGPMEEFLNKYVGDNYFIAKGSSKYDLEVANTEARLEGQSKGFKSSSIVDQKAFKKDGEIIYIIIYSSNTIQGSFQSVK